MKHRAIFIAILLSLILASSSHAQPRDRLMLAELMRCEYQDPAPLDNRFFMPLGTWESARHRFEGTLIVPEFLMHHSVGKADSARPWEYFPGFSIDFFTHGKVLVPVSREVIQPPGDRNYWRIVVSPGTIWSEPGDSGLSRASFPFALVNNTFNDVHNGLATFAYDETRVSSLFLQVTQETSPVFKADFWGATPVVYRPNRFENRKLLTARFAEEEKHQIPILPFSALAAKVDAVLLDPFTAGIDLEEISATGLIRNDTLYLHPCCTRTSDYPYGRYMRHAAYSLTKAMGALIAMLRLAEKYGEGVFDLRVADYVEIKAAHDGWKSVTFADALNMATGVGDHRPERVEPNAMHGDEDQPRFMDFLRARSRQEKMAIAFSYGDYPWGPGEVARYNSINTFILSAAMDAFLKSKEGPEADIWDMVLKEVFQPIGIFHAPIMRTIEPDGSRGLPPFGYGLYPNVDDVAKLSILLQNGGRHQGRQLLHSGRLAEALYQTHVIGLPTGEKDESGEVTYCLAFNGLPWRCKEGRIHRIPVSTGFGGNHWVLLPNGITTFRFCDANQYGVGSMIEVAEGIGVTQTAQKDDPPVLRDPYLSQKPPGELPEVFAPSILFSENPIHGQIAFYPDGKEIYWIFHPPDYGQNPPAIHFVRQVDGRWTKPEILEFSREYGVASISISPDGTKLFFDTKRPWPGSWGKQPAGDQLEAWKIWVVERTGDGWGEPELLDRRINQNIMGVSSTRDGTLYTHGIKRIRLKNRQYAEWEQLGHPLDVGRILGGNPFISPDESYILFNKNWPGKRGYGIFISYRTRADQWTEPINLLERLNVPRGGSQPVVTPDGKYLFYYAGDKFYWVDAKIIKELSAQGLK